MCWFLFNQRGQAPLPDLFYSLIQVPFDVCATENRTSQEEGLAPALTHHCMNPLQHTNTHYRIYKPRAMLCGNMGH